MYKELSCANVIDTVTSIQFCLSSPEEILRRSVVEVVSHEIYSGSEPVKGGVLDMRMGTIDNGKRCPTCGMRNTMCPGHFGHIELARPVFYVQFMDVIKKLLKCVCFKCGSIIISKDDISSMKRKVLKMSRAKRFEHMYQIAKNKKECWCCKCKLPSSISRETTTKFILEWKKDTKEESTSITLYPEDVRKIFKRISDEDAELLGFSATLNRPEWMICTIFPVPPPCVRPTVHNDIGQRREDDLTFKICEIVKYNNTIKTKIANNASIKEIDALALVLQYHVATYADNKIPGMPPATHRNGRSIKSITERIKHKEGRIRGNLMGKRVDYSARSVITPDPNISIDEVGVPVRIAMNLTFPEIVNEYNREHLQTMADNGPDIYPGAKFVEKTREQRTIKIGNNKMGVNISVVLENGDVVYRHLINGDPVLFNRQPSLHKMSMMCHRVRVMPYDTFRLNVCVCAPYNADMDGDEMNMHVPQSIQTAVELRQLAAVPLQIISPRTSSPIINIIQDLAVGVFRLTQPDTKVSKRDMFNLLSVVGNFTGKLPTKKKNQSEFSGADVFSHVIPLGTYYKGKNIEIVDGQLISGVLSNGKENGAGKVFANILHNIFREHGPDVCRRFLDDTQRIICEWLCLTGFSMGISDLVLTEDVEKKVKEEIRASKSEVDNIIASIHNGSFVNDTIFSDFDHFESKIKNALSVGGDKVSNLLKFDIKENRMINMIESGAKGSTVNVMQMMGSLGQQAVEEDKKRVPYGFDDRTLPHFSKFDDSARARGFVENSFMSGLTPYEYFFHAMAGREGLIDTAVKSVTGDTPIYVLDCRAGTNTALRTTIGEWIDLMLTAKKSKVQHFPEDRNLEMLQVKDFYIPTTDEDGHITWGEITAVTRHDPGTKLFRITTEGGRSVIVSESKSMLVFDSENQKIVEVEPSKLTIGDAVPVTASMPDPPCDLGMLEYMRAVQATQDAIHGTHSSKLDVAAAGDLVGNLAAGSIKNGIDVAIPPSHIFGAPPSFVHGYINNMVVGDTMKCPNQHLAEDVAMMLARISTPCSMERCSAGGFKVKILPCPTTHNDVLLDKIVAIEELGVENYPKLYDLTVPSTLNFGLANGLQVRDTSDTGYIQRKLVKSMEDCKINFDMTVRNAANTIVQFAYGGDGYDSTKLDVQALPTVKMTLAEVKEEYLITKEDWTGDFPDHWASRLQKYYEDIVKDRNFFIRHVSKGKKDPVVFFPVNISRTMLYAKSMFNRGKRLKTDIDPMVVLDTIDELLKALVVDKFKDQSPMIGIMLRAYLNPKTLVIKYGMSRKALDYIVDKIKQQYINAIAHPSELVGILAAQSIGEPSTQMTLNSVEWNSEILVDMDGEIRRCKIGQLIDDIVSSASDVQLELHPNDTTLCWIQHKDFKVMSCDENGKISWKLIEAVTKHPPINEDGSNTLVKVVTKSGREVIATKAKSFLKRIDNKIVPVRGDEIKVGDHLPVAADVLVNESIRVEDWNGFVLDKLMGHFWGLFLACGETTDDGKLKIQKVTPSIVKFCTFNGLDYSFDKLGILISNDILYRLVSSVTRLPEEFLVAPMEFCIEFAKAFASTMKTRPINGVDIQQMLTRVAVHVHSQSLHLIPDIYSMVPDVVTKEFGTINVAQVDVSMLAHACKYDEDREVFKSILNEDILYDEVVEISEVTSTFPHVYDLTVKDTRNFNLYNGLCIRDTFHLSGVASASKSVQGVPRLKELLEASKNIKTPQMKIFLKKIVAADQERCQALLNELETTYLKDIVIESAIYYDPRDSTTDLDTDKEFVAAWNQFESYVGCADGASYSPWVLRFEFDKEVMLDKGLTMYDVYYQMTSAFSENIKCVYSDDNFEKLVMRIRIPEGKVRDYLYELKVLEQQLLDDLMLKGIPGIKKVVKHKEKFDDSVDKRKTVKDMQTGKDLVVVPAKFDEDVGEFHSWEEFVLETDGTNLLEVLAHPLVDPTLTISNDVLEIYEVLGVEAACNALLHEIKTTLDGLPVQDRHLELLVDVIACKGHIMSINRHGINRGDNGPLAKCSFEESAGMLVNAGVFAEMDKMNGVSANVMLGQIPSCGTGDSKLMVDFEKLTRAYKNVVSEDVVVDFSNALDMLKYDFESIGTGVFI